MVQGTRARVEYKRYPAGRCPSARSSQAELGRLHLAVNPRTHDAEGNPSEPERARPVLVETAATCSLGVRGLLPHMPLAAPVRSCSAFFRPAPVRSEARRRGGGGLPRAQRRRLHARVSDLARWPE